MNSSSRVPGSPHRQKGDVLIVTLMVLLVLALGFFYASRSAMLDTASTGSNLARQKGIQVNDQAMRALGAMIYNAANGSALEYLSPAPVWYRNVPPGTPGPGVGTGANGSNYWSGCLGNASSTLQCGVISLAIPGSAGAAPPYSAMATVQPTGRADPRGCADPSRTAIYYDIYLITWEGNAAFTTDTPSSATAEAVYKLCVYAPDANSP